MKEIIFNNTVLARHIIKSDIVKGLNFFSNNKDFIQVGIWGNYQKGKDLGSHMHNEFERISYRTHEMLFVISGQIEAKIYSLNKELIDTVIVNEGEILILLECCHGYKILEDNTTVLETKNGPYFGAEKDRIKF